MGEGDGFDEVTPVHAFDAVRTLAEANEELLRHENARLARELATAHGELHEARLLIERLKLELRRLYSGERTR
jgi:hypothetical protein